MENKYELGMTVKVVQLTDFAAHDAYLGKTGTIVKINTNGATGNTDADPLYLLEFEDGKREAYWGEEIAPVTEETTTKQ